MSRHNTTPTDEGNASAFLCSRLDSQHLHSSLALLSRALLLVPLYTSAHCSSPLALPPCISFAVLCCFGSILVAHRS